MFNLKKKKPKPQIPKIIIDFSMKERKLIWHDTVQ